MSRTPQFDPVGAVLTAVAAKEETDPEALTPPLADVIEPDALERLLRESSPESEAAVRFSYRGHEIVVDADGDVEFN